MPSEQVGKRLSWEDNVAPAYLKVILSADSGTTRNQPIISRDRKGEKNKDFAFMRVDSF
jgi:hypothetical protein